MAIVPDDGFVDGGRPLGIHLLFLQIRSFRLRMNAPLGQT